MGVVVCVELNHLGRWTVERESRVDGRVCSSGRGAPSSAGLVKSRVNLPRPLGKPEYSLVTDSA